VIGAGAGALALDGPAAAKDLAGMASARATSTATALSRLRSVWGARLALTLEDALSRASAWPFAGGGETGASISDRGLTNTPPAAETPK
jgi:hypothetical protein